MVFRVARLVHEAYQYLLKKQAESGAAAAASNDKNSWQDDRPAANTC